MAQYEHLIKDNAWPANRAAGTHDDSHSETVVVIGAHPDDACLGAGGVAAQAANRLRVVFVSASRGERGGDPWIREVEDRVSAELLGVELVQWGLPDGDVGLQQAIELIGETVASLNPIAVVAHWPLDSHQDHRNVAQAAIAACRQVPVLLHFESPSTLDFEPALEVDISDVWPRKFEALVAHESHMTRGRFIEWADPLSLWRAWPRYKGRRCEAFAVNHADWGLLSQVLSGSRALSIPVSNSR
jgi:LmbE family N-acetylglucosaminyl deacetylase